MRVDGAEKSSDFIYSESKAQRPRSQATRAGRLSSMGGGGAPSCPRQFKNGRGKCNKALDPSQRAVAGILLRLREELVGFACFQGSTGTEAAAEELPHSGPEPSARCPGLFGGVLLIPGLRCSFF